MAWLEQQLLLQHARQQQQQQQQQQQPAGKKQAAKKHRQAAGSLTASQADPAACVRIHGYLTTIPALADCCGDQWLAGPLASHMQLCVRLAWAVLRCEGASPNSSGGYSTCRTAEEYGTAALIYAAAAVLHLVRNLAKELSPSYQPSNEFPQLADGAASNALYCLLLMNLAQHAMWLQKNVAEQRNGQEALPEQHHSLLLQELGVEWLAQGVLPKLPAASVNEIGAAMVALRHHMNLAASPEPAACLVDVTGTLHALLGTGAAAAELRKAYSSHPQQVCQGLEAALRLLLLHAVISGTGAAATLGSAARRFVSSKPGSSSSSSSSDGPAVYGPAAKQLFSLLVTCVKAADQQVTSSSSNSDRDCTSENAAAPSTTLADILISQGECSKQRAGVQRG
ncbi:hypothetical protein OEZ86_000364 [Tetradesmus obliquus]|nr:hypothetical protein OEZ86_000364 [Tetradesmus obliquus]